MAANDKVLYLLSSTVQPYIKDILDILFLPSGFTYRFRYNLRWTSDELHNNGVLQDVPREALLVHAHITKNSGKDVIEELIPIRRAKIIESKIVGDFVLFQFELDEYVKYDIPHSWETLNPYHQKLSEITTDKLAFASNRLNLEYVQDSLTQDEQNVVIVNWSNLISRIGRLQPHKKSVFLKLLSVNDAAKGDSLSVTELSTNYHGFEMRPNTTYRIRILQRSFEQIQTAFRLKLETDQEIIKPIKADAIIQGKYDVLEFIIFSSDLRKTKHTAFLIKPNEPLPDNELIISQVCGCKVKAFDHGLWILPALIGTGIAVSGLTSASPNLDIKNYGPLIGGILVGVVPYLIRR